MPLVWSDGTPNTGSTGSKCRDAHGLEPGGPPGWQKTARPHVGHLEGPQGSGCQQHCVLSVTVLLTALTGAGRPHTLGLGLPHHSRASISQLRSGHETQATAPAGTWGCPAPSCTGDTHPCSPRAPPHQAASLVFSTAVRALAFPGESPPQAPPSPHHPGPWACLGQQAPSPLPSRQTAASACAW